MEQQHRTKQAVLEELLDLGMVMITLDARCEGVSVPPSFADDPQLRLNLSYRFGLPMEVGEWGIYARLTFGGVPYDCRLPWEALYVFFSHVRGQPFVFPEDVPQDLLAELDADEHAGWEAPPAEGRPALSVVRNEPAEEAAAADAEPEPEPEAESPEDEPEPPSGRRRGHLRVVK